MTTHGTIGIRREHTATSTPALAGSPDLSPKHRYTKVQGGHRRFTRKNTAGDLVTGLLGVILFLILIALLTQIRM